LPEPPLIEWHGAQRWVAAEPADAARLREAAARAGGHATLFRAGSGHNGGVARFAPLAAPQERIHRELKRQFDPAGIFNRGRMYAGF
jgi:glycolate oxidase FAD binding subunit